MNRRNFITILTAALGITKAKAGPPSPEPPELRLINPAPPHIPERPHQLPDSALADWLRLPQKPFLAPSEVPEPDRETATHFLHHIHTGRPVTFAYAGGSSPHKTRAVTPVLLFHKLADPSSSEPKTYLLAHRHLRHTTRTFRLDRIRLSP